MIYKINDFKINYIDVEDLAANYTSKDNYNKNKIALLYINGEIFNSDNKNGVNSEKITKQIYDFKKNKNIKAVIIRVNSPGGSAYGAEQMWKAISDLKSKKPVIISMSDYAASGGYYLSADANKIFSSKYTVTGSIGIFGMFFTLNETANELGITFDEIKTSTYSDFLNPTHEMSKIEQLQFQNYINHGYELFTKRVAQGRDMNIEKVKQIAGGRVYTGTDALNINLVDTIGGINDAISYAKKITHLNKYSIIEYPEKEDLFTTITKNLITSNKIDLLSSINNYFRPLGKVNSNLKDKFQSKAMAEMQTLKIQ